MVKPVRVSSAYAPTPESHINGTQNGGGSLPNMPPSSLAATDPGPAGAATAGLSFLNLGAGGRGAGGRHLPEKSSVSTLQNITPPRPSPIAHRVWGKLVFNVLNIVELP